ncbi:hypothetical protein HFN45_32595 [Rhizobium leguminosarum]|nr:hypothetical protein [Rhizobium leguminosarum]
MAGIVLGVVFLIFRQILAKSLFPMLSQEQSFAIILSIIVLTFGIGAIGLLAWLMGRTARTVPILQLLLLALTAIVVLGFATHLIAGAMAQKHAEDEAIRNAKRDAAIEQTRAQFVELSDGRIDEIISSCQQSLRCIGCGDFNGWAQEDIAAWRGEAEGSPTFSFRELEKGLEHLIPTMSPDFEGDQSTFYEDVETQKRFNACFVDHVRSIVGDPRPYVLAR